MKYHHPIHIVAARRTPIGRFGGGLKHRTAVDLAEVASRAALGDAPPPVESVIFGQVLQAGTAMNLARQIALRLDLGQGVTGFVVNMVCGSGLKAVALAADEIENGSAQVVLAGGAESMSQAPYYLPHSRWGHKLGHSGLVDAILHDGLTDPNLHIHMGETAERIAVLHGIDRDAQDAFALRSQQKAAAARESFAREIVTVPIEASSIASDEQVRSETTIDKLSTLRPAFDPHGTVTAGNASSLNDGAAALLLAGQAALDSHGLRSRARIVGATTVGCDPAIMGLGPIGAVRKLIGELNWDLTEVDAVEINEAFAVQAIACIRELGLRDDQVNLRGGAIALGHPIGCSGARVLVTLLHILEDRAMRRGIATLCIGGGMGIAMAIERE